jgi:nucleoside-diphosphate-sugar epimerase
MNWIGAADTVHEYVSVPDAVRIAATLVGYPDAYGQRWIVPGAGPITGPQVVDTVSFLLARPSRLRTAGIPLLRTISLLNSTLRGLMQVAPEYVKPITYEASKLEGLIGRPAMTPYDEGITKTLGWLIGELKVNA